VAELACDTIALLLLGVLFLGLILRDS